MLNRQATKNTFRNCWWVIGRGGRLPRKNLLIEASIQAMGSRSLKSWERHLFKMA